MKSLIGPVLLAGMFLALRTSFALDVPRKPVELRSPVQDRNFYVLSLMERTPGVGRILGKDPEFAALYRQRAEALKRSEKDCAGNAACTIDAQIWTPEEMQTVGRHLLDLYRTKPALRAMVAGPMRRCGFFELYRQRDDADLLQQAWLDAANGINHILRTYGLQIPPHYARIDAASFDPDSPEYWTRLDALVGSLPASGGLFFAPSLKLSLLLLAANRRDEAGRFEPLDRGENSPALRYIRQIVWDRYPYSAILVPGAAPNDPVTALSATGRARAAQGAALFRQGKAPLIIVSGGFVHPAQTRFCEALEMKEALIRDFQIPPSAILVDPYARHTTTNFRNAVRLIYRYGIPFDKYVVVVAEPRAIAGIVDPRFDARNRRELGYLPYRKLTRVSPDEAAFQPSIVALEADSGDPLDP